MTPYEYEKWLAKKDDCRCASCLDHGYRAHIAPGVSLNAEAAEANKIKGRRVPCPSCGPAISERASQRPALQDLLTA